MQRWIVPASVVAILISLAALLILLAAGTGTQEDVAAPEAAEEPATAPEDAPADVPQTIPEEEPDPEPGTEVEPGGVTQPEDDPAVQEEQPPAGGQTTPGDPTEEDPTAQASPLPGPETATIRITGDSAYYCTLGVIGETQTVQGRQPASYEVEVSTGGTSLDTVMAACQKISPGTLGIQIRYAGEVLARDETEARLGTVSVSWNPLEE